MAYKSVKKRREYQNKYYSNHKDKRKLNNDRYRSTEHGFRVVKWNHFKRLAKNKGLSFTIEKEDIPTPVICNITGITIDYSRGNRDETSSDSSPVVTRINPLAGYVKNNLMTVSRKGYLEKHPKSRLYSKWEKKEPKPDAHLIDWAKLLTK